MAEQSVIPLDYGRGSAATPLRWLGWVALAAGAAAHLLLILSLFSDETGHYYFIRSNTWQQAARRMQVFGVASFGAGFVALGIGVLVALRRPRRLLSWAALLLAVSYWITLFVQEELLS